MVFTSEHYKMLGTTVTFQVTHPNADNLLEQAYNMLADLESRFSANASQSDLMNINIHAGIKPVKVDKDLFKLIKIGRMYSIASLLNLNIAIGPLVKLWQIGSNNAHKPQHKEIDACLKLVSPQDIQLDEVKQTVFLPKKGMELDLGALAKGYFSDILKDFFVQKGVKHGVIDLGANVQTIGQANNQADGNWLIDIPDFQSNSDAILGSVKLVDEAVVTSTIYERSFLEDGKLYHHILDSRTGYPINAQISSLSIISKHSLDCEIWATILFYNTWKEAIGHINNTPGIEGIAVDLEGKVHLSAGIHHRFIPASSHQ